MSMNGHAQASAERYRFPRLPGFHIPFVMSLSNHAFRMKMQ